jgi:hypothetical protein
MIIGGWLSWKELSIPSKHAHSSASRGSHIQYETCTLGRSISLPHRVDPLRYMLCRQMEPLVISLTRGLVQGLVEPWLRSITRVDKVGWSLVFIATFHSTRGGGGLLDSIPWMNWIVFHLCFSLAYAGFAINRWIPRCGGWSLRRQL